MDDTIILNCKNQTIKTTVQLPSTKSISNRVLIIQALCTEKIESENLSQSDDTQFLKQLLSCTDELLFAGEGGTTFRFLVAYLALRGKQVILTASERMLQRPFLPLIEALNLLGAKIELVQLHGTTALKIYPSKMMGGKVAIDATNSSQFISALLLIAPYLPQGLQLKLMGTAVSSSYINMTVSLMKQFGVNASQTDNLIVVNNQQYVASNFKIESDWSAASYWYSFAALSFEATIFLPNLSNTSLQGDKIIASIMEVFGVATVFENNGARLTKTNSTLPPYFEYDFINCPDLFQTVCVVCAVLNIPSYFTGLQTLQHKETNRLFAMATELIKLNAIIKYDSSTFEIKKGIELHSEVTIATYNDHRMAMAFAPLALKTKQITIEKPSVVSKSYPNFWNDVHKILVKQL